MGNGKYTYEARNLIDSRVAEFTVENSSTVGAISDVRALLNSDYTTQWDTNNLKFVAFEKINSWSVPAPSNSPSLVQVEYLLKEILEQGRGKF